MNDRVQTIDQGTGFGYGVSAEQRNKVLRNTYWLLALSMLPTVLGAWLGVATGITASLTGGLGLIVFLGGAFGFMYAIEKTKNSAAGVPVLLAFTFRDLSGMGKWLMVGALAIMIGGIINVFVGSTAGMMAISVMAIGVFSAFMLYDLKRIVDGGETNYISATLGLYLSAFNVFQSLLALLGIAGGERD
ncbi:MAG: Bax inhibitor-1 family protein [Rhodoferax sp.]|nr:Bax inhibitor-1 family protein [Rhodoferax sp.]